MKNGNQENAVLGGSKEKFVLNRRFTVPFASLKKDVRNFLPLPKYYPVLKICACSVPTDVWQ